MKNQGMISLSGDKKRRFPWTDTVAGGYPASFVVCYGKIRQAHRTDYGRRFPGAAASRLKLLMLPKSVWKIMRFHLAGPLP
jgi:hypothetical protein